MIEETIKYVCKGCGEFCDITEIVFDYSGTHCTNGNDGTHHTGQYESDCCGDNYNEVDENDYDQ